ncbi:MAG: glycosyltransferase family 39 protein [Kaiparowitsia implicata GSE-PSE-MK54-09C]|jgi:4-amino-4-deoxy-L-arabinose transferase-like glycosyltransferase|nr:glycosyltransferase family 39 protein [Kaiparowitsia implicata GSE-PSE-MK54-09C]
MNRSRFPAFSSWRDRLEKYPAWVWGAVALWLAGICWLAFVWNVGSVGLVDETEPLFAEAARQMTVTGDWVTPYFNEETRFDKPPLVYWLMAIAYQTIGVNELAVRLPSVVSAIALTVFGFFTLWRFGFPTPAAAEAESSIPGSRWASALIGSGMMALHPQTMVWARTGVSDMLLSGCMGCALLAFFWGYAQPARARAKSLWYLAFWVLLALAVLAKGPVGIVLPGLIVMAFALLVGKFWTLFWEVMPLRGALLFVAIALPWYILVYQANGQTYIDSFFGYHNIERFTSVVNRHAGPWYFYVLIVLGGFIPHSIHLPLAIARLRWWRWREWQQQPRQAHLGLFALVWFTVIFGFFTVAVTKLPSYVLPLLPAAAILVALLWSDRLTRPAPVSAASAAPPHRQWGWHLSNWLNVVVLAALAAGLWFLPVILGNDVAMPNFPEALRQSGAPLQGAIAWGTGAIAATVLLLRRQGRWLWVVNLLAYSGFVIASLMPTLLVVDVERQLPLRQLSEVVVQQQQPNEVLMMAGFTKPSVVFYTQRPFEFRQSARGVVEKLNQLSSTANPPESALILGLDYNLADLNLNPAQVTPLDSAGRYDLVRVDLPLTAP